MTDARYTEIVTRKNWFLELARLGAHSTLPLVSDPAMVRLLYRQCGDLEMLLYRHEEARGNDFAHVSLLSAASCYALGGDVEAAEQALRDLTVPLERETRDFFTRHGVAVPLHL